MSFELAALGSALCWSLTGIISTGPSRHLGGVAYTRIRMLIVFVIMLAWVLPTGALASIPASYWPAIILSGIVGIVIGDSALFTSVARLGPRRTGVLFASNAPMTVVIGWLWFGEALGPYQVAGCVWWSPASPSRSSTVAAPGACIRSRPCRGISWPASGSACWPRCASRWEP
ncbi:MAG: DMT family transporter [Gammaproteobacteria bacterium]|nr:DMT family transporter [Gammaproteobacteria bacterium]